MPMVMAVVLEGLPWLDGFGFIVSTCLPGRKWIGSNEDRSRIEKEAKMTAQMNGMTEVMAGGEEHGPATGGCGRIDRPVDGSSVQGVTVSGCAEIADVPRSMTGVSRSRDLSGGPLGSGHDGSCSYQTR